MLDLREWLEKLEGMGVLKVIKGIHWDLEIGAVREEERRLPDVVAGGGGRRAFLFDDIVGYPSGYRVVINTVPNPRQAALCMGVPETDSLLELNQALRQKLKVWEAALGKFNPNVVKTGPVMENVDSGEDVDLFKFPIPKWYPLDVGRYIGPGDAVITRDPDTGEINFGMYRVQIHDKKTMGNWISPGHHGRLHREKYHARGEACPVAISIGHHPLISTISCHAVPFGTEYNLLGAISGEPVSVIKEEITGLPIPAASEIVIVGWCPANKTRIEGPFGEWTGYYSQFGETPFIEVERVYYRNNPIIEGGMGVPLFSAMLLNHLERCGVPDVRGVWTSDFACATWIVVSIKQRYGGHARQAALVASQAPLGGTGGAYHGRYVIVVDDDIDPTNIREVLWAICTRSDPAKDIEILHRLWSTPLDPTIFRPTPDFNDFTSSRAIIDACRPFEWMDKFAKVIEWSPELLERVRQKL